MKWFSNPATLEELKNQYRNLAMQHHPDRGGTTADMQEINAEYDRLFARLKNTHKAADGTTYTTKTETSEAANDFREIIERLIHINGINIEICGAWLWITGNTYEHRETLKALNFRFSKSKKTWYFHGDSYKKLSRKTFTLEQIRALYGSEEIIKEPQLKLAIV